jgi:excisionase family DNA binding protein
VQTLTLQEAADRLGVHYMTIYRYVRTGRLPAVMQGGTWQVDPRALDGLRPAGTRRKRATRKRGDAKQRIEERLLAGDERGAWAVVEDTLASGADPVEIHLELLAPALRSIGDRWESGELTVADEHRASVVARRVLARLGPQFNRRGRKRGTVVIGAVAGELHDMPTTMLADQLRGEGYAVVDLGANTPAESFAQATRRHDPLTVLIGVTGSGHTSSVRSALAAISAEKAVPVLVGGAALPTPATAKRHASAAWTGLDARSAIAAVASVIATRPKATIT